MINLALAAAMALGTALAGWWAVPAVGFVYGMWRGSAATPFSASCAAMVGWGALMAVNWFGGPTVALSQLLGAVLGVPGWILPLVTLAFPALLAGTSAALGSVLRPSSSSGFSSKPAEQFS